VTADLPTVLCVDDDPAVLQGLELNLRRKYALAQATSGAEAINWLTRHPPPTAIVSDMQMPGMNGAQFLNEARRITPDSTRLLLTGYSDVAAAIAAINQGQIFRFLTKPCSPAEFLGAIDAAAEQFRLVTGERTLLEKTLQGSIKALVDVLALIHPVACGRASRLKEAATAMGAVLPVPYRWQLETAAQFSQLGLIVLSTETAERVRSGVPLLPEELAMRAKASVATDQLLAHIPRLEGVREILARYPRPYASSDSASGDDSTRLAAYLLRVIVDADGLQAQGYSAEEALATMRGREGTYAPEALDAFASACVTRGQSQQIREISGVFLRAGMVLAEDVRSEDGRFLAVRGYEVTEGFIQRLANTRTGSCLTFHIVAGHP
jgi:CheY-like chemotaxis protein